MAEIILKIFDFILTSAVIFFLIAFVAILLGRRQKLPPDWRGPDFSELFIDYSGAPELQRFTARDGTPLAYRHYPAESDKVVILFHGSGYHSRYLLSLAGFISSEGLAQVYTPDLRGHGLTPKRRGDVDYINQMDDDGWTQWSKFVLKELERLNHCYEQIQKDITKVREDIAMLRVKAGVWGALAGLVPGIIAAVVLLLRAAD